MLFIRFLLFVDTIAFSFFIHSLYASGSPPVDLLGLVASTVALTILLIGE